MNWQPPTKQIIDNIRLKLNLFKQSPLPESLSQINNYQDLKLNIKENNPDLSSMEMDKISKQKAFLMAIENKIKGVNTQKIIFFFNRFLKKAQPQDIDKINHNIDNMNRGPLKKVWYKIESLVKMIRDPNLAWTSKVIAIAALLYLITPLDAIPDFIPFAGLTDDFLLIVAVVSSFANELEKYLVKQAETQAEIEIRKQNKIVRTTLIGSIAAAVLAIILKIIIDNL